MGLGTSDVGQGRETDDPDTQKLGLRITLHAGDVVVHPAGTSHENVTWEDEYGYLAFFPVSSILIIPTGLSFKKLTYASFPMQGYTEVAD